MSLHEFRVASRAYRRAGVLSLFGVAAGFVVHMLATAVGLTALFMAIPLEPRRAV